MADHGGLDTPMTPYTKDVGPAPSDGTFYGPNMIPCVTENPSDAVFSLVQFGPGGFAHAPMDSPFTTATPIDSKGGGDSQRGSSDLDSPMKDKATKGGGY